MTQQASRLLRFTFDTNCVLAVDENRLEGQYIMALVEAHKQGSADVAIVAMMASERQKTGDYLHDFTIFSNRLARLGMSSVGLCLPLAYWNISFWNHSLWSGEREAYLEKEIHKILFPDIELSLADFCTHRGLEVENVPQKIYHVWRNAKCDVQAIWSHINAGRDIFVTSDENFLGSKKGALVSLGAGQIEKPQAAANLVCANR